MDLLDNNSRNFLNDVLTNQDRCSTLECPDNYIQEITGLARCNGSPCNVDDDLDSCFLKIKNLIDAEMNDGSKDYDINFIRNHVEKLVT